MPHDIELRQKVIDYVENRGNVTKASRIFGISRASIYRWLNRKDLRPTVVKTRQRKLDKSALYEDVVKNPDDKLIDRAKKIWSNNVSNISCIQKNEHNKKKKQLRYRERNRKQRIEYLQKLRELVKKYGSKSMVFIDESGFEEISTCIYGWSKKGKKNL